MIIIDFQLPQSIFNEYKNHNIAEESAAVIEETFFLAPIRMQVNGVELLQSEYRSIDNQIIIIPWLVCSASKALPWMDKGKSKKACAGEWVRFDLPDVGGFLDFSPESEKLSADNIRFRPSICACQSQRIDGRVSGICPTCKR